MECSLSAYVPTLEISTDGVPDGPTDELIPSESGRVRWTGGPTDELTIILERN